MAFKTGDDEDMMVVPGVKGGEGCSTSGGCATCPYMKMNSLDSLMDVVQRCQPKQQVSEALLGYLPPKRTGQLKSGKGIMEVGSVPIVHMRALMAQGVLSKDLVQDVTTRVSVP